MSVLTVKDFPIGKKNRITREALISLSGMSDRGVRANIKNLRDEGYPIMSSTKSKESGYWLPESYEELESWVNTIESYARSIYRTTKKAKKIISNKDQKLINYDVYNQML